MTREDIERIKDEYTRQQAARRDCISRQAAIDAVNSHFGFSVEEEYWSAVQEVLNDLPSVQPEIIRCEDCKYWDTTWQNDWAKSYHYCPLIDGIRNGDWYCADAER